MYDNRELYYKNHKLLVAVEQDDCSQVERYIADGVDITMGEPNPLHVAIINRCGRPMISLLIKNIRLVDLEEARVRYGESHHVYTYLLAERKKCEDALGDFIKAGEKQRQLEEQL